ncbi:MAG TPA: thiosulfate oxidation carrier protein SoxY, partial [Xanthobacteraceae bacterium]|nr:thiosulfate oxidation carrier protein SoxY [Xanthobacteraceae bacterium]
MRVVSRRAALALGLGTAATWAATRTRATPSEAEEAIAKFTGGQQPMEGRIAIDLPEIAENGTAVPLAVTVESPMTGNDRVTDVLVVADGNPNPRVATFHFTPLSGRAEVATRIRLNATENVIVVARTGDGRF